MAFSIQRKWSMLAGARAFNVKVGAGSGGNAPESFRAAFDHATEECAAAGFGAHQIVRSRLWARDASTRQVASNIRLEALAGEKRAASASFIAPERLGEGIDMIADITVIDATGEKIVREYEPRIAPPMYVALGDHVFLSGNTDISVSFDAQIERICANIANSLDAAHANWSDIVNTDAYVSIKVDARMAWKLISSRFPCAIAMTSVQGYSAPEKLVEIEVTTKR